MSTPEPVATTPAQNPAARPDAPARQEPDPANRPLVLLAAATTVILWASAFVVVRWVGPYYDPGSMALVRMLVGSVALGALAAVKGVHWPSRRAWPLLVAWGVGWFCLYNLALNTAERQLDAGTTAMIVNLAPLLVVVVGGFLGEGFPKPLLVGAPISFLGVVLIGTASGGSAAGRVGLWGMALALAAAVLYGGCALVQKRLLASVDSVSLTWLGAVAGTVALLPWTPRALTDLAHAPATATLGVVYMGIFPTAIAFTTWAYVLSRTTAGRTAATTYVVPALVVLLSWVLLQEAPTTVMLLGGALCLLGVFVTRLPSSFVRRAGGRPS